MFLKRLIQKINFVLLLTISIKLFRLQQMNLEVRTFYNRISAHGCIHSITKPTRVTSKTVSLIDNILTNFIFDTLLKLKKGIIKSDVSDHFSVVVCLCFPSFIHEEYQKIAIHKRVMHDTNLVAFKADLRNVNWNSINHSLETNSKYETFFKIFSKLNEKHFPLKDFPIEVKDLQTPWISKGLKKSSKQKQKFYIKFLKNKSIQNE